MFKKDELVWAKSSGPWQVYWPAKVIDSDSLLTHKKKKPVIACVQFLAKQTYEAITDIGKILPFNCDQKHTFLTKGQGLKNLHKKLQFGIAVKQAEQLIEMLSDGKREERLKIFPAEGSGVNHNCRETGSVRETVVADAPKAIDIRRSSLTEFESKEKELPERKEGKQDMAASVDEGSICLKEELKMTGLGPKRMRGNEEGICLDKVQNFCKRGKKYGLRERVGSSNTETTSESTTTGKRKMGDVPADEIWSAEKKAFQRGGRNEASMEPGSAKSEMTSVSMEDERTILAPRTEDGKRLKKVNRFRRWKKQTSGCVSRRFSGGSRDRRRILRDHLDLKLSKNLHNKGTQDSRGIHVEATTDIINKEVSAADGSTALNGGYSNVSNGNCDEKLVPESNNGENVSEMRSEANEKTLELINRERRHVNEQTVQEVAGEEELSACDKQQNGGDHEDIKLDNSQANATSDDEDDYVFPEAFSPSPGSESVGFRANDVVWVKYGRSPYWPSQIRRITGKQRLHYVCLLPKGGQKCFRVSKKNIISFSRDHDTYENLKNQEINPDEREKFVQGLKEAEDIMVRRASQKDHEPYTQEEDDSMYSRISDEDSFIKAQSEERFDVDGRQEIEERLGNEAQENRDVITPQQRRGLRRRRSVSKYKEILHQFHQCKKRLVKIFREEEPSERHQKFRYGSIKEKNSLKYRAGFGPIEDDDVQEQIIGILRKWYGEVQTSSILKSYIYDVWLPEAIIYFIQNTESVNRSTAEKIYSDHASNVTKENYEEVSTWFKERTIDESAMQESLDRAKRAFSLS